MLTENDVKKGDVIQVNENGNDWAGCLMIVDDVRKWGVQAYMHIPNSGEAFLRVGYDQMERIGRAVLVAQEEDD